MVWRSLGLATKQDMKSFCSTPARFFAVLILTVFASTPRAQCQTPPQLNLQLSDGFVRLSIAGDVGSGCTIQSVTNLSQNWQFVTNFTPSSNQSFVVDPTGPIVAQRFYRVYSQLVPTNVVATNMVWISPGAFTMGSPDTETQGYSDERPQTHVTISHGFWMAKFEVTQNEYSSLMGYNNSWFKGTRSYYDLSCSCYLTTNYGILLSRPVEQVNWSECTNYCAHLTFNESNAGRLPTGYVYRLPTEAEWEYACRAATTTAFSYGPALRSGWANFYGYEEYDSSIGTIAIYNPSGIYLDRTVPVGSYSPNPWGLYDMQGNVWEWCQDWYGGPYSGVPVTDPRGGPTGSARILRGGAWYFGAKDCRSGKRLNASPDYWHSSIGFRVVLAASQP